jgi:chromate reductase
MLILGIIGSSINSRRTMKILGIAGSLREGSYNKSLLLSATELAPKEMDIEIFDLGKIPPYNQDLETNLPEIVKDFKDKIIAADGILFATPEYNYSIPGVLKNAIDWASRPFGQNAWENKAAAIIGASTGMLGTARAQTALRQTFTFLNVFCMNRPEIYVAKAADKFSAEGKLTDDETKDYLKKFLEEYEKWILRMNK